jgi:3-deoxy-D-manno-octulosonic-acid transferase
MWRRGGFWNHFFQRFGWVPKTPVHPRRVRIWIQAVSVGEVQSLKTFILQLQETIPVEVYLTTTTATGFKVARDMYSNLIERIAYFPINFWPFSALAWRRIHPHIACLTDSDFWPEHLHQSRKRGVPMFLLNGRCSDRSFERYQKVKWLTSWLLSHFDHMWVSSDEDFKRFVAMGARESLMSISGNFKFDNSEELPPEQIESMKASVMGEEHAGHLVLFGASTWPGEEAILLDAYGEARRLGLKVHLILVPRHVERREEIETLLKTRGLDYNLYSRSPRRGDAGVYVLDTTGQLKNYVQLADVVFVGKSTDSHHGGQNPIEVAAYGKAIVYGPNMENFRDFCDVLEKSSGSMKASTPAEASRALLDLLQNEDKRRLVGQNARLCHEAYCGASTRVLKEFLPIVRSVYGVLHAQFRSERKKSIEKR